MELCTFILYLLIILWTKHFLNEILDFFLYFFQHKNTLTIIMNASSNQTDANWNEVMEREWKCFSEEVHGVGYLKKYFVFMCINFRRDFWIGKFWWNLLNLIKIFPNFLLSQIIMRLKSLSILPFKLYLQLCRLNNITACSDSFCNYNKNLLKVERKWSIHTNYNH